MAFEEIAAGVRAEGRAEIEEIRLNAKQEMRRLREESESETRSRLEALAAERKQNEAAVKRSVISAARRDASNRTAQAKADAVSRAFKAAGDAVLALPDAAKKKMLSAMIDRIPETKGPARVLIDSHYKQLIPAKSGATVKTQELGDFGVIIESEDGRIRVDMRLQTLLSELYETIAPEVADILFKNEP
ncbi:MAG: V-type ATP synthase subunit E [Candidatus Altiarchaeota archaeon]|nr:V-type ATP synthase subunit E [Candidatus Altiarchaeota archaeon]